MPMTSEQLKLKLKLELMQRLGLADQNGHLNIKKVERAYERAHNNRDFEIELYWKRATYFWGFQATFMAVAGIILANNPLGGWSFGYLALISLAGFCITILWGMMSLGAKFWQYNWERYVDLLEPYVVGEIYKFFISDKELRRPFSVTKVNMYVIYVFGFFWAVTYFTSGYAATNTVAEQPSNLVAAFVFYLVGIGLMIFSMAQLLGSHAWKGLRMGDPKDHAFTNPALHGENFYLYKRTTVLDTSEKDT
ncbi:hypothetical protein [Pacificibacter sp. AS14]|uniref:RipA family octameric membrane protein n=1 Tax=Pacificibacter sp. AS14 TaxID=3135785 RepID=UPI00317964E0